MIVEKIKNYFLEKIENQKKEAKPAEMVRVTELASCKRKVWYRLKGYQPTNLVDEKSLQAFEDGSALEEVIIKFLEKIGVKVIEQQVYVNFAPFKVHGYADAIIEVDNKKIVLEIKTANSRAFSEAKKRGILKQYPQYVWQALAYAVNLYKNSKIDEPTALILIKNKDDGTFYEEIYKATEEDEKILQEKLKELSELLDLKEPPEKEYTPQDWQCRYCSYNKYCWKEEEILPKYYKKVDNLDNVDLYKLLEQYNELNEQKKEIENKIKEIKAQIEQFIADKEEEVQVLDYKISWVTFRKKQLRKDVVIPEDWYDYKEVKYFKITKN